MASECEDDGIVIEESLRESYFDFIDIICDDVLQHIYNQWSTKLITTGADQVDKMDLIILKDSIVYGFYKWIQLRLPDQTIIDLPTKNNGTLELVFMQLNQTGYSQQEEDSVTNATDCITQLLSVSKKKKELFKPLIEFLNGKIQLLADHVPRVVEQKDVTLGE